MCRMKRLPKCGSQCKCPEMNVISSNMEDNAVETFSGEIL